MAGAPRRSARLIGDASGSPAKSPVLQEQTGAHVGAAPGAVTKPTKPGSARRRKGAVAATGAAATATVKVPNTSHVSRHFAQAEVAAVAGAAGVAVAAGAAVAPAARRARAPRQQKQEPPATTAEIAAAPAMAAAAAAAVAAAEPTKKRKRAPSGGGAIEVERPSDALFARANMVAAVLDRLYPDPPCPLNHRDPFTLLCAVLLSAQTTDGKVNEVTEALFDCAPTPQALAVLSHERVLGMIRTVGLAPTKARHLIATAQQLCERFGGAVPRTMEELVTLPGVGRKTASVVLSGAFGVPAFPVDTHIHRLALRWRLAPPNADVPRTEAHLRALFAPERYGRLHLQFIYFGREYCQARNHERALCPICSWADAPPQRAPPASPDDIPQLRLESPRKAAKTMVLYAERTAEIAVAGAAAAARLVMAACAI